MAHTNGNSQDSASPGGARDGSQQLIINAQYVKDLSFGNPRAPQGLAQPATAPAIAIDMGRW